MKQACQPLVALDWVFWQKARKPGPVRDAAERATEIELLSIFGL